MPLPTRKPPPAPRPPMHLQPMTRRWFASVVESYELEPHHVRLLQLAGEAWDRCNQARAALVDGLTYLDKSGAPHPRPEVAIERDSRIAFSRLIRELDLDADVPGPPSRPPPLRSNRGRF
jgi:hypothetical protein